VFSRKIDRGRASKLVSDGEETLGSVPTILFDLENLSSRSRFKDNCPATETALCGIQS
jgi:hypothetical protein